MYEKDDKLYFPESATQAPDDPLYEILTLENQLQLNPAGENSYFAEQTGERYIQVQNSGEFRELRTRNLGEKTPLEEALPVYYKENALYYPEEAFRAPKETQRPRVEYEKQLREEDGLYLDSGNNQYVKVTNEAEYEVKRTQALGHAVFQEPLPIYVDADNLYYPKKALSEVTEVERSKVPFQDQLKYNEIKSVYLDLSDEEYMQVRDEAEFEELRAKMVKAKDEEPMKSETVAEMAQSIDQDKTGLFITMSSRRKLRQWLSLILDVKRVTSEGVQRLNQCLLMPL